MCDFCRILVEKLVELLNIFAKYKTQFLQNYFIAFLSKRFCLLYLQSKYPKSIFLFSKLSYFIHIFKSNQSL